MLSPEIKRKIKYLQIKTKRILSGTMIGDHSSAIKGTGHEFDQIREYQQGDDVRFVDWKSSARMNKLLVKQYFEERNRNIVIAVDISASSFFSSKENSKFNLMSEIATILTLVAQYGKDNIGLLLFSDEINEYLAPAKGNLHINKLIKTIFEIKNETVKTNFNIALEYLTKNTKKNSIVFFISDFINENNFEDSLKAAAKKNKFIIIHCLDEFEKQFPEIGLINIKDFETNETMVLDTSTKNLTKINNEIYSFKKNCDDLFRKNKISAIEVNNNEDYFIKLIIFFKKLMTY